MSKSTPAARASRAAAGTSQTRKHVQEHRDHRKQHEMIAMTGGAVLGGTPHPDASRLALLTVEQHGERIPMTPKEAAAVDSLITDHPGLSVTLTRRDPGEAGPLLAHVGDDTYLVGKDGSTSRKAVN